MTSPSRTNLFQRFRDARSGSVGLIFGLSVIPIVAAAGMAIDYSRVSAGRAEIQAAVDTAALAAARDASNLTNAQTEQRSRQFFEANFRASSQAQLTSYTITRTNETITVRACAVMPTTVMGVVGVHNMPFCATSVANYRMPTVEIALALDNTGSMAWSNKMNELKVAVRSLLTTLETQVPDRSRVKISLVPFDTQVNVGTSYRNQPYVNFNTADLAGDLQTSQAAWTGCIVDRNQPHDVSDANPAAGATAWRAARCGTGSLAQAMPLTNDFAALRNRINQMTPSGYTNVTMGVMGGLATLTPGSPFPGAGPMGDRDVIKYLIVLTDGDNTRNRWSWSQADIDARTRAACNTAKGRPITVFTIRVIEGNAALLRDCASTPANFYDVQNASQLTPVFQNIARQILSIRLTS
jgi:Flp pilus assembly protein TadG